MVKQETLKSLSQASDIQPSKTPNALYLGLKMLWWYLFGKSTNKLIETNLKTCKKMDENLPKESSQSDSKPAENAAEKNGAISSGQPLESNTEIKTIAATTELSEAGVKMALVVDDPLLEIDGKDAYVAKEVNAPMAYLPEMLLFGEPGANQTIYMVHKNVLPFRFAFVPMDTDEVYKMIKTWVTMEEIMKMPVLDNEGRHRLRRWFGKMEIAINAIGENEFVANLPITKSTFQLVAFKLNSPGALGPWDEYLAWEGAQSEIANVPGNTETEVVSVQVTNPSGDVAQKESGPIAEGIVSEAPASNLAADPLPKMPHETTVPFGDSVTSQNDGIIDDKVENVATSEAPSTSTH